MFKSIIAKKEFDALANYKAGAYVVRFLMGIWLLFITSFYVAGIKIAAENMINQKYFDGIGIVAVGMIFAFFFFGFPIYFIKTTGTEEIFLVYLSVLRRKILPKG